MADPKYIERFLDEMDLQRLEGDRCIQDMDGWGEKSVKGRRWTLKRVLAAKDLR